MPTYTDITLTIHNRIGTITFNRPAQLNAFGGALIPDVIAALRALDAHPDTVFTVLTGAGRFFSAGADVKGIAGKSGVVCLIYLFFFCSFSSSFAWITLRILIFSSLFFGFFFFGGEEGAVVVLGADDG